MKKYSKVVEINIDGEKLEIKMNNLGSNGVNAVLIAKGTRLEYTSRTTRNGYRFELLYNYLSYEKNSSTRRYDSLKEVGKKWRPYFQIMFKESMKIINSNLKECQLR